MQNFAWMNSFFVALKSNLQQKSSSIRTVGVDNFSKKNHFLTSACTTFQSFQAAKIQEKARESKILIVTRLNNFISEYFHSIFTFSANHFIITTSG